jgi:hypothetical protein
MDKIIAKIKKILLALKEIFERTQEEPAEEEVKVNLVDQAFPLPFEHDGMIIHTSPAPLEKSLNFNLSFKFGILATDPKNVIYHIDSMYITGQNEMAVHYLNAAPKNIIAQMISIFCKVYHISPYQLDEEMVDDDFGLEAAPKKEYMN